MTQHFPTRQLRFFLTAPSPCPYLPERYERKVFAHLPLLVNERLEASAPGVWAIGECAGTPQFTHASVDDFRIVRDNMAGGNRRRLKKLAKEYIRPGVHISDLHEALMRIQQHAAHHTPLRRPPATAYYPIRRYAPSGSRPPAPLFPQAASIDAG